MSTIINVSNRLPVTVGKDIRKSSGGLVAALEGLPADEFKLKWIGWPGGSYADRKKQQEIERTLGENYGYIPVFITKREADHYYQGFSNSSLWPILHYMPNYMRYDDNWWAEYERVNLRFAEKILDVAEDDDIVWVHDYHLMLLPAFLRSERPRMRIGFFLHTPFPSYEIFRCHPKRLELMHGLLGADQIGFHTFGYLRHFRSTVLRLIGMDSEMNVIPQATHHTYLGVYPIGINGPKFQNELDSEAFAERRKRFQENWRGKKLILSVERLDYTKGLIHRLEAIDLFLSSYHDRNRINFIFVNVPSRGDVPEYRDLLERIEGMVGNINGKYSTVENSPIHFIHHPIEFTDLCALYSLADVCLVTPLIDGMNLVAKEYVACQDNHPGVLVLSEFAGAAQELFNATIVNPYDASAVAKTLTHAFSIDEDERRRRMEQMRSRVYQYDSRYWANSFIDALRQRTPGGEAPRESREDIDRIVDRVKEANRIAFFLDYEGTLREQAVEGEPVPPHEELRRLLRILEAEPRFDVYVISERSASQLEEWLGDYNFGLIAEQGTSYRSPISRQWRPLSESSDLSWKSRVREVFKLYEGSTPGSTVEERSSALIWHYRQSDPEFGQWKANLLVSELYEMLANMPAQIHHEHKSVEVISIQVNKGAAVEHLLREADYDFVICAGDDQTDESMFRLTHKGLVSVKVGKGDTHANYRMRDPRRFRRFMMSLTEAVKA